MQNILYFFVKKHLLVLQYNEDNFIDYEDFDKYLQKELDEVDAKRIIDEFLWENDMTIEQLKGQGKKKNNREISQELFISEGTVKNVVTNILEKLELRDRTQLAVYAVKNVVV